MCIINLQIASFSFILHRSDRNRGDIYNRGGNRNDVTRPRDDKDKPVRRDKSAGDSKDLDRMPKYQAPVKPVSFFTNISIVKLSTCK